jgi:peptidoglycan-N-acetylglucosamine deacetylase
LAIRGRISSRPGCLTAVREIEQAQTLIGDLAHPDRLFRPMGSSGHLDARLFGPAGLQTLADGGYTVVLWNALPREWLDPDGWIERALELCRDGALLVVHDIATGAMKHLEQFLDQAVDLGVRFTQDFPADCVPICRGDTVGSLDGLITRRPHKASRERARDRAGSRE